MSIRLRSGGKWCKLPAGEVLLGRHESCTLQLDDPRLSRQHARLTVSRDRLRIEDLGSANGVHVNGQRIDEPTPCGHGDRLVVGPFTFDVEIDPDSDCPAVLEGSLHEAPLASSSNENEFLPSTDRHADGDATVVGEPVTRVDGDPLTPNPADDQRRAGGSAGSSGDAALRPSSRPTTAIARERSGEEPSTHEPEQAPTASAAHPFESDTTSMVREGDRANFEPQTRRGTTVALMPRDPRTRIRHELERGRWARLLAAFLDALYSQSLALAIALPCVIAGYVVALEHAGAGMIGGVPILAEGVKPAGLGPLAASLTSAAGWGAVDIMLVTLRAEHREAFLVFFVAATAAVLAWLLVNISLLVAATMIKGAPYWHRRFGFSIRDRETGLLCSPGRSALRWLLAALLGWMAPVFILLALPSPHDKLAGCVLRRRSPSADE